MKRIKKATLSTVIALGAALCMLFGVFSMTAKADSAGGVFTYAETANFWGRSDLRSYMNGVRKESNTLPYSTAHSERAESGYYESQFNDAEYGAILPYAYYTVTPEGQYRMTDRFWLPSLYYPGNTFFVYWGAMDISVADAANAADTARIIPAAYYPYGMSRYAWTRSTSPNYSNATSVMSRGAIPRVNEVIGNTTGVASVLKLDVSSVSFASTASAAKLADNGGIRLLNIPGSSAFGTDTSSALPDYGMYLKRANTTDHFKPYAVTLKGRTLTVQYYGGVAGQYAVVQAYRADSLTEGSDSYEAVAKLNSGSNSVSIDISEWTLSSLNGFTLQVWMEDASEGSSMASATTPVTFFGEIDTISYYTNEDVSNPRVFAMKEELGTSWGALSSKSDLVGANPTNQKIYLGENNGEPLQFWIAGRETYSDGKTPADGDGTLDPNGNVMTLYQAKIMELRAFNASAEKYMKVPTLTLQDERRTSYSGSPQAPEYTCTYDGINIANATVSYEYRIKDSGDEWTAGKPINAGHYEVRATATGAEGYETVTSVPVSFKIAKVTPSSAEQNLETQEVYYGTLLGEIDLASLNINNPTHNGVPIEGEWKWISGNSIDVGDVGSRNWWAKFVPTTDNYEVSTVMVGVPVVVKPQPLNASTVTLSEVEFIYSGEAQKPTVSVSDIFGNILAEGVDYDIIWPEDAVKVGTKNIKIKFKGNFASDNNGDGLEDDPDEGVTVSYVIAPARINVDGASALDKNFDGTASATLKELLLSGMKGTDVLTEGVDYTVTATFDNANAGKDKPVTLRITLISDKAKQYAFESGYETDLKVNASISPISISDAKVELEYQSASYTGNEIKPSVTVRVKVDGVNETLLVDSVDYEVSYLNNISVGTATVKILGKGNFTSEMTVGTFEIKKADPVITSPTAKDGLVYNGETQALVNAGAASFGTLEYSLDGSLWSKDIPTAKEAGDYTVYFRVVGDANCNDHSGGMLSVRIAKEAASNDETNNIGMVIGIIAGSVAVIGVGVATAVYFGIKKKKIGGE